MAGSVSQGHASRATRRTAPSIATRRRAACCTSRERTHANMNKILYHASFFAGLAVLCWVSAGYAHSNPLALVMTVLVGVFYLMGAVELHRFQQATTTLTRALAGMPDALPGLG